jgi:hypothetical protein
MRIDAAAELLRLEYEKARLAALRGRLASGLGRAEIDLQTTEQRVAWVLDMLGTDRPPSGGANRRHPTAQSAEQRLAKVLELLGANVGTSR